MLKKAFRGICSILMIILLTACSMTNKSSVDTFDAKPNELMIFTPQEIKLESYLLENEKVSHVVFPKDYKNNIDKTIDNIKKIASNSTVKAVVIATEDNRIFQVFKEIKKDRPGVITIAAGDFSSTVSTNSKPIYLDSDIDLGFVYNKNEEGKAMAELAKNMGAKEIYLYSKSADLKDKNLSMSIKIMNNHSNKNQLKLNSILIPDDIKTYSQISEYVKNDLHTRIKNKDLNQVAVLGTSNDINSFILKNALRDKYIVPGIFTVEESGEVDGYKQIYNEVFDLKLSEKEISDSLEFKNAMNKKMKRLGLKSKIAGYSRTSQDTTINLAGMIAVNLLEKQKSIYNGYNEMFAQIMGVENLYDIVNTYLDSYIDFENTSNNSGYFKTLLVYPDIY